MVVNAKYTTVSEVEGRSGSVQWQQGRERGKEKKEKEAPKKAVTDKKPAH